MSVRKIISYSFYGTVTFYPDRFLELHSLIREMYPDWDIRFYYSEDAPDKYVTKFQELDCEMIPMGRSVGCDTVPWSGRKLVGGQSGMLWRYLPFWDDTVDVFTVCDMDEIPSYTKRYGIQLWEETDKLFHTVQTWKSPSYVPGGGKISGRGGALIGKYSSDVLTYLASSEHFTYNDDQLWLARISSSVLKDSRLVHYILPLEPMSEDAVPLKIVPASKGGLLDVNRDFYLSLAGGHSHFIPEELALLDQQTSVESLE